MDETYRVPMRLSAVLGLLPLLSGSTCTSRGVQTAMDLVDKARMDEELEQCYEVLDRNIEYYHAWKPGRTTASSADEPGETEDGYRTATFRGRRRRAALEHVQPAGMRPTRTPRKSRGPAARTVETRRRGTRDPPPRRGIERLDGRADHGV